MKTKNKNSISRTRISSTSKRGTLRLNFIYGMRHSHSELYGCPWSTKRPLISQISAADFWNAPVGVSPATAGSVEGQDGNNQSMEAQLALMKSELE